MMQHPDIRFMEFWAFKDFGPLSPSPAPSLALLSLCLSLSLYLSLSLSTSLHLPLTLEFKTVKCDQVSGCTSVVAF